ncbi:MAG: winged helix-turn-helix domain-containing protein [Chthoniobacteraceae bacterium]
MKLQCADLAMDLLNRTVTRAGTPIDLTPREFALLEFLLRAEGRIVGRAAILQGAWGYNFEPGTNIVDVYIKRLRNKIDSGQELKLLSTERNLGYSLKVHR